MALAWVEAYINPFKIPQAIAASAQAALIAAMPIPQYYDGGFMPRSTNDKDAFPIIAHANEYMINANSMRDPYVMNTVQVIETAKSKGVSPSDVANGTMNSAGSNELIAAANRLENAAAQLQETIAAGIMAKVIIGDNEILEMEKLNKILIERGEPALGDSIAKDIINGSRDGKIGRASVINNL